MTTVIWTNGKPPKHMLSNEAQYVQSIECSLMCKARQHLEDSFPPQHMPKCSDISAKWIYNNKDKVVVIDWSIYAGGKTLNGQEIYWSNGFTFNDLWQEWVEENGK